MTLASSPVAIKTGILKVKLATAAIGISSIHLLKSFINATNYNEKELMWQTIIPINAHSH